MATPFGFDRDKLLALSSALKLCPDCFVRFCHSGLAHSPNHGGEYGRIAGNPGRCHHAEVAGGIGRHVAPIRCGFFSPWISEQSPRAWTVHAVAGHDAAQLGEIARCASQLAYLV